MKLSLLVIQLLVYSVVAIFEDQAGKFDWRKTLIGCPKSTIFDDSGRSDRIVVFTKESIMGSLSLHTGKIEWRRILESTASNDAAFTSDDEYIYTLSDGGRIFRSWRKVDGVLVRQILVSEEISTRNSIEVLDGNIFIATSNKLMSFTPEADSPANVVKFTSDRIFSSFFKQGNELLFASVSKISPKLNFVSINKVELFADGVDLDFVSYEPERCHVQNMYISCFNGNKLSVADVFDKNVFHTELDHDITNVSGSGRIIFARGITDLEVFEISNSNIVALKKIKVTPDEEIGFVEPQDSLFLVSPSYVRVVSITLDTAVRVPRVASENHSPLISVFVNPVKKNAKDYELLVVGADCRLELLSVDVSAKAIVSEWNREESLINVESVELVDLPLTESQQMIEDEFEDNESNIMSAFIRRLQVQFGQFCRILSRTFENIFYTLSTFSIHGNGLSDFINSIRSTSSSSNNAPFERDYFNLRKVILATTINGAVFGIDSNDGSVLWKIWLGDDFAPLESISAKQRVPLYVQRTTAHYQLDGLASVVFSNKKTKYGVIVTFNPMIGQVVSKNELPYSIKRISLLPITNQKHVYPILVVDEENEISFYPSINQNELSSCSSLFLMDVDRNSKTMKGLEADLINRKLRTVWSGNIGLASNEEIVAVKGKSFQQKVHSQGRVLINRDVQYKYVNPNLAAVASLDRKNQQLTIVLVDIVTGHVVHSAKIVKAAEPVHLVHSENWIAYSYWSEKGRRTELGIIELYEGHGEQARKEFFDSKLGNKHQPAVLMQSYIYAQGVEAMTISETEKGLSMRSILLAHPSGNIHEVSRRLLDATRPMELTPAMREEMIIGYVPEIAVSSEEMINYNLTVHRVRGIKASPSGLESTSLVLAYGTDLFFTRLVPSGTFDILKDDFDHIFISMVLSGLVFGSYITKRLARSNALSAQWS
uniref:ER membrane protein complex subunit 1 n=1 Tax=Caenorhabditis japonica TaxID=281687 RepID=A0A8R1HJH4_CAEJA